MSHQKNKSLPLYRSHKVVRAAQICAMKPSVEFPGSVWLSLAGQNTAMLADEEYMGRCTPHVGGYFVQYEDGYCSYSPAKAFEEGYTPEISEYELKPGTDDHYSQAQRKQHEVDLLTQLVGSLNNCMHSPTHKRLQDIVNKQLAVVEGLIK